MPSEFGLNNYYAIHFFPVLQFFTDTNDKRYFCPVYTSPYNLFCSSFSSPVLSSRYFFFRYVDKFGFRFVICSRMSNIEILLKGLRVRCRNSFEDEVANGIEEVKKITALRMKDLLRNWSLTCIDIYCSANVLWLININLQVASDRSVENHR